MKKLFTILMGIILIVSLCIGCVSRVQKNDETQEKEVVSEDNEPQDENLDTKQEEKDDKDDNDEEQVVPDSVNYKIKDTGYKITINKPWTMCEQEMPNSILIVRDNNMMNRGNIIIATGDTKKQLEKDMEGVFDALEEDKEINDYKLNQTENGGLYRIDLSYNVINPDNTYMFTNVIYQETKNGLIALTIQMTDQYFDEVSQLIKSLIPSTDKVVDIPYQTQDGNITYPDYNV